MAASWVESPAETRAEELRLVDEEIGGLVEARDKGLRPDSDLAARSALARLRAYREKVLGQ